MKENAKLRYWDITMAYYDDVMEMLDVWRKAGGRHYVCFCDANGLAHGWRDDELKRAYRDADAVFADGIECRNGFRHCRCGGDGWCRFTDYRFRFFRFVPFDNAGI